MNIETSTLNVLLCSIFGLQVWMVREVFTMKTRIELLTSKIERDHNERND